MSSTPVISGFYPDPSICSAGDTYYIANSSFEYMPGVPIWSSTDLLTWNQIGNALTRPTQIPFHSGGANSGIYAPTLRHHGDKFWLVTTNINEVQRGHLIVTAENPSGPWSDPVYTAGTIGIDPDLSWDEDGVCHLTWASFHPTLQGIASCPIDPSTGKLLGEPKLLWPGTGLAHPEGPHLYRINGWWYLLLAEGGTERGHAVTIARAASLDSPFEAAPDNPILSHRSLDHPVQNTGHADLVQLKDGTWAMVHLGVRPRGQTPSFHTNGRETFLTAIDWVDGWPVVDEDKYAVPSPDTSFEETFEDSELHPRWVSPGVPPKAITTYTTEGLVVSSRLHPVQGSPTMLCARVRDTEWTAEATVEVREGTGHFKVQIDDAHWYGFTLTPTTVRPTVTIGPSVSTGTEVAKREGPITLRIRASLPPSVSHRPAPEPDLIILEILHEDGAQEEVGTFDGRYLSTEVAGGFTGRVIGVAAVSGEVLLRRFTYRPLRDRG